ncbi:Serpin B10 [Armadillidium vulgare]|nr:Serpin B10 [Armadillidium vulgare]
MLHMGSKGNTEKQIMTGMHLPQDKELIKKAFHDVLSNYKSFWNPYQLHTSNLIYIQERFQVKDDFLNSLKYFLTSIKRVNFGEAQKVAKEINKIVEKETKSKITNIVSPDNFNAETLLVLVNAIYFKANWDVKLKIENIPYPFFNSGSQPVDVEMMYKKSKYRYQPDLKDLKAKLLALDYKGSRMCFVILLPNEINGLGNLEEKLKSVDLGELDRDAVSTKLGMIDMFNEELCNLSGISSAPEAYVSDVIHKAFLDVTEVGCEAAAATGK